MSTLQTTFLKHPDAAGNQITFTSGGDVNFDNGAVYLDSTNNRLGVGTTSPGRPLQVAMDSAGATVASLVNTGDNAQIGFQTGSLGNDATVRIGAQSSNFVIYTNNSRAVDVDTSGRLLVGTISSTNVGSGVGAYIQTRFSGSAVALSAVRESGTPIIALGRANGGAAQIVAANDELGEIRFAGADDTDLQSIAASIVCEVDGTPGADDMPGRLVFSTTSDGASSPTERMKLSSSGQLSGQAIDQLRVQALLYARLIAHGGCSTGGPSGTFSDFDSSEPSFFTVSRTTSTAPNGYSFIGDGSGNAWAFFVGCGDNPVFTLANKDSDAPTYQSWVLVDNSFAAALGGAPLNATRTSLP